MKLSDLLQLLFPPKCIFCGALLPQGMEEVCARCRQEVLLSAAPPRTDKGAFYAKAIAALPYTGEVRRTVRRFKFSGKQSYARPLARILSYAVGKKLDEPYDLITFVPTNARNLRRRGYNQAELLARELAAFTGRPCLETLKKTRSTQPMYRLKPAERRANALGAFALCCRPEMLQGKTVLLVDDVLTTGATISECARMLREGGAKKVFGAAAASPPGKKR
ncbi:MAG: ComF family protein [Clostridiaceae bacterium]|nr:ComF family protein [Clostridiaceae bacterium]